MVIKKMMFLFFLILVYPDKHGRIQCLSLCTSYLLFSSVKIFCLSSVCKDRYLRKYDT